LLALARERVVVSDDFTDRLAAVRRRFASNLPDKIAAAVAALPALKDDRADAPAAVEESYRRIHGITGVGPSIGFTATGAAAREAEAVLLGPLRARRGLDGEEIARLERMLAVLSATAQTELQVNGG
jgi:Hpt domain